MAQRFYWLCSSCSAATYFYSSSKDRKNAFDINVKSVHASYQGTGLAGITKIRFLEVYSPENIVNINNKQVAKVAITVDGTWQKHGPNSKIGVLFILSVDTGEVLDVMVKSLFCTECNYNKIKFKNNTVEFNSWYSSHKGSCCINHERSSSSMEAKGAAELFLRSIEKRNLM